MAQYWIDLNGLPASEAGMVFRSLDYGRPSFGWGMPNPPWPVLPEPVGFGSDIIVHYDAMTPSRRSEEHTSELQSLMRISYAVFCLKKKTNKNKLKLVHIDIT